MKYRDNKRRERMKKTNEQIHEFFPVIFNENFLKDVYNFIHNRYFEDDSIENEDRLKDYLVDLGEVFDKHRYTGSTEIT